MSQENAKKFMELLNTDKELQQKVKTATEAYTGDKTDEKEVFDTVLAPIAKESGHEFTFEDVEELAKAAQDDELSENEVAAAAGGGKPSFCIAIGFNGVWEDVGTGDFGCGACYGVGVGFGWW